MADGVTATSRDAWPIAIIHSDLPQASNEVRVPDIPRTLWTTSSVLMGEEKCSFLTSAPVCLRALVWKGHWESMFTNEARLITTNKVH